MGNSCIAVLSLVLAIFWLELKHWFNSALFELEIVLNTICKLVTETVHNMTIRSVYSETRALGLVHMLTVTAMETEYRRISMEG